jgi:hypothetical protein
MNSALLNCPKCGFICKKCIHRGGFLGMSARCSKCGSKI